MDEAIIGLVAYLVLGMGLISIIWIFKGMKKLTTGLIKGLFKYLLAIASLCLIYAAFNFCLVVGVIEINDPLSGLIHDVFIVVLFIIITRMALHAKFMGETYGFKE